MNQKEAVFNAIVEVKGTNSFEGAVNLTREERERVSSLVAEFFTKGSASFADGKREGKELTTYISGLISNWIRKDNRLNGNTKYVPKNPGSRLGSQDEVIKAMKTLLSVTADPKIKDQIQAEIDKRIEELKPKTVINTAILPESLRKYAV